MARKRTARTTKDSRVITRDILQELIETEAQRLKDVTLTAFEIAPTAGTLPYNSGKVFGYAQSWCGGGNNCPDGSFPLDCTHFICHCLQATEVYVTAPSAMCQKGLCIRVNDLAAAFNKAVNQYTNVKRIARHSDTRRGDFCFIPSWFPLSKEHAMLLRTCSSAF